MITLNKLSNNLQSVRRPSRLARLVVGAAALSLLAACGGAAESEPKPAAKANEKAPSQIAKAGSLTACVDPTVPPMEFFGKDNPSKPIGFDIDMVSAVAKAWGVKPVIKESSFTGLLPALSAGTCDVVWSAIFMLPERLGGDFQAVPYLNSGPVILTKAGNPAKISAPEDLSGKTVAVQSGTNFPGMLADLNKKLKAAGSAAIRIQEYQGADAAAQQVLIGRAQAFLALDADGSRRSSEAPKDWEIAYTYPKDLQYGVFYLKKHTELGTALEAAVKELITSGVMKASLEEWKLPTDAIITP